MQSERQIAPGEADVSTELSTASVDKELPGVRHLWQGVRREQVGRSSLRLREDASAAKLPRPLISEGRRHIRW